MIHLTEYEFTSEVFDDKHVRQKPFLETILIERHSKQCTQFQEN